MGLFDQVEGAVGGQGAQDEGTPPGVMGAVLGAVQSHPGGMGGIVSAFEGAGLGGAAQSWLGGGANQPVSAAQVQQAMPAQVGDLASKLGVSHDEAAGHLSDMLPQIMDHLSPNGQAPQDGGAAGLGGLLAKFGGS